ncbi:MAG: DNA polymerase III subunit beta [Bacilli bacterium]|nr:DNA polymerase III subunit beta [Bacilli bacterium]
MKFTIEKNIILENLSNVVKAISPKNIIPILNGVKVELTKEGLYLTASDSELTIKAFIDKKDIKKVEEEGSIIIQSKYILDIIRKMPSDEINFELMDGLKIKISSDNSQYDLNCLDPKEYPTLKLDEVDKPIVLDGNTFKSIISQTAFAISTQELRPLLTGLNFNIVGDVLECIATDSYRLAKKNIKLDNPVDDDINIVIPGKNIMELDKIIVDEEPVEMHVFSNKVLFKYKNIIFQSNLLSGTYPNTSNLIPKDFAIIINTKISDFFDAIDRAALLTQNKDKNIVKMKLKDSQLVINSYASEIGKVEEKLDVETSQEAAIDISFSAKYMLDALKTIKDEEILILLNGEVKPIVIKSVTDESLIQLILPIKTY